MASTQNSTSGMTDSLIRIGTRKSPLALAQAAIVARRIENLKQGFRVHIIGISTQGDQNQVSPLSLIGGKGIFIRELEDALLRNEIDIAVHSLKDVTSNTYPGLALFGFLKAESVNDILVSLAGHTLESLPRHAIIGTGSMRRKAILKYLRPDVRTQDIRGNIGTRVAKLHDGLDAILLSDVSLIRLGLTRHPHQVLPANQFIPAPGQGVITLEARNGDHPHIRICRQISHPVQFVLSNAQLAFLKAVGFDCQTPLGMHSHISNGLFSSTLFRASRDLSKTEIESFSCDISVCLSECTKKGHEWKDSPL